MPETVPTEEVDQATGPASLKDAESNPSDHDQMTTPDKYPQVSESIPFLPSSIKESNPVVENRYVLPPRKNRGIPPIRYEPDYVPRTSRYPVDHSKTSRLSETAMTFQTSLYKVQVPKTVDEAKKHPQWMEAMQVEMDALERNKTWERCSQFPGKKSVGCRWVFTVKRRSDGIIERYKARLVTKGYIQTYGVDYSETFSPVLR